MCFQRGCVTPDASPALRLWVENASDRQSPGTMSWGLQKIISEPLWEDCWRWCVGASQDVQVHQTESPTRGSKSWIWAVAKHGFIVLLGAPSHETRCHFWGASQQPKVHRLPRPALDCGALTWGQVRRIAGLYKILWIYILFLNCFTWSLHIPRPVLHHQHWQDKITQVLAKAKSQPISQKDTFQVFQCFLWNPA